MTPIQQIITILIMAICVSGTRFISFLAFPSEEKTPKFVKFLGQFLASSVFGMLVVYCLKDVHILEGNHGLPQFLGIAFCVLLHLWKKKMFVTIAGGTLFYMLLVQVIF